MSIEISASNSIFRNFVINGQYKELSDWLTNMTHCLWVDSLLLSEAAKVIQVSDDKLPKTVGLERPVCVVPQLDRPQETVVVGLERHISPKSSYNLAKILDGNIGDPDREVPISMAGQLLEEHYRKCMQLLNEKLIHWGDEPRYVIIELQRPAFFVQQSDDLNIEAFCYVECGLYIEPPVTYRDPTMENCRKAKEAIKRMRGDEAHVNPHLGSDFDEFMEEHR